MTDHALIAKNIRKDVIRSIARAGKGNVASNLSTADSFTALYFGALKHNPREPGYGDRVFASKHLSPVWQTTKSQAGYFSAKELFKEQKENLNTGLSTAIGSALAARMDGKERKTYCIISDHELNKGENWEAIMLAGKYKLNNFTLIIDRSNIQADGYTEEVMPLEPLRTKYEAFNWNVTEVDGHNHSHIIEALKEESAKPKAIIAHTIPGKGISFIENKYEWHEKSLTKDEEEKALKELA